MSFNGLKLGICGALTFGMLGACGTSGEPSNESFDSVTQSLIVAIPSRIQAENFERANETTPESNSGGQCTRPGGVDMETASDPADPIAGNCNVGWTAAGEWLEYDINTPSTQTFNITARVASNVAGRTFRVLLDGVSLGSLTAPASGWQAWQDRTYSNVSVAAGNHVLRIFFENGEVNLNYLEFTQVTTTPSCSDGIKNGTETGVDCGGSCPACPTGCVEQALTRTAATSSSSETTAFPATLAIDGNATTRWSSAFSDPQWIYVDLGATRRISKVVLRWEAAASANYRVEVSSSTSGPWSPVFSTTTGDGGVDTISGLSASARYVRMYSNARNTAWGNSLFEFEVYGDPNPNCGTSSACVIESANTTPLALARTDIGARQIIGGITQATRLALDPISGRMHYMTLNGNIYQLNVQAGSASTSTLIVTGTQIMAGTNLSASTFQGMTFAPNGTLYVVSNVDGGATNRAFVRRGTGSGSRSWVTFAQTDPYPDSNTPFDHHFSGIVVSPDGNSVYLTSGSRTDHGEVQDTGGQFPGAREVPLTAAMFVMPTSGSNILLRNDRTALVNANQLFASGLRNSYDPTFGPGGDLFAGDNGPDADYSEELNVIRSGQHYGFPWRLGGENNSQQFSTYNPATDSRLHAGFAAVDNGSYRNDPTFPTAPSGLVDPVPNRGPDADQFRDVVTGGVVDASATGRGINTFTAHRVPLGLSFDLTGALCGDFKNKAFILSWGSAVPVFSDKGEDLLMLELLAVGQSYEVKPRQLITGLSRPIDSVLLGNKLYVLEYADGASGRLFEISLPKPAN